LSIDNPSATASDCRTVTSRSKWSD
jgi:hypothetical protein